MFLFSNIFDKVRSVLILGFGKEGRSTYRFLRQNYPHVKIGIADQDITLSSEKLPVTYHLGNNYFNDAGNYDLIIKSPGVKLNEEMLSFADRITSQTDLFLCEFSDKIIGVTGTKGKSTTASLLYHVLKKIGKKALLLGNIGLPAFNFISQVHDADVMIYELSAHQLERVYHSPHWAILLNLYPEHLDYFGSFQAYKDAKLNIFRFQKRDDFAFCGNDVEVSVECLRPLKLRKEEAADLLRISGLQGDHNLNNILLVLRVMETMGVPLPASSKAIEGFQPLSHRLEYVGNFGKVDFYNDSISTIPQSTIAAVKSLPVIDALILGGFDRGLDYSELVEFLVASPIRYFFFLGKAGKRMFALFERYKHDKKLFRIKNFAELFDLLNQLPDVSSCLLSPAAASYDQFRNFEQRGNDFKKWASRYNKA